MKLPVKARYGLCAMFDIAFHAAGRSTQVKDIAEREEIPARFLEQIFQDLKRAGLVTAKRGPRGGYALARPASEITLGQVLRALDGNVELCSDGKNRKHAVDHELAAIGSRINALFDDVSIESLCARAEEHGQARRPGGPLSYAI